MRCAACGFESTDANAENCPNCGQPLPIANQPNPAEAPPAVAPVAEASATLAPSAPVATPTPAAPTQQTPRLSELLAPLPPVRKRPFAWAIPIIAGVVIVAATLGLFALLTQQENNLISAATDTTATSSAPHTPVAVVAYQNTFAHSAGGWSSDEHCFFGAGGYHVSGAVCFAPTDNQDNLDVVVTAKQTSGSTISGYGISLRAAEADNRYDVVIDSNSQWAVYRCDGLKDQNTVDCNPIKAFTSNSALHGGLNVENTIEVRAQGSHFDVTLNGVSAGSFDDTRYASGKIGIAASPNIECVFTDLTVTRFA